MPRTIYIVKTLFEHLKYQAIQNFYAGQPTKVEFHVTVMSLDSINEGSMVS